MKQIKLNLTNSKLSMATQAMDDRYIKPWNDLVDNNQGIQLTNEEAKAFILSLEKVLDEADTLTLSHGIFYGNILKMQDTVSEAMLTDKSKNLFSEQLEALGKILRAIDLLANYYKPKNEPVLNEKEI